MSDALLTLPDASVLCQRPYISMYSFMTAGRLGPVKKRGRVYLVTREAVEAFRAIEAEKRASKSAR